MWRDSVDIREETPFGDWPVLGPQTAAWCLRFIYTKAGVARDDQRRVKFVFRLAKDDYGLDLDEWALRALGHMQESDWLGLPDIAAEEDLLRAAQLIVYVYYQDQVAGELGKGQGKNGGMRAGLVDEAHFCTGAHREDGERMAVAELLDYVAKVVERDASMRKQIRKGREERTAPAFSNEKDEKGFEVREF